MISPYEFADWLVHTVGLRAQAALVAARDEVWRRREAEAYAAGFSNARREVDSEKTEIGEKYV